MWPEMDLTHIHGDLLASVKTRHAPHPCLQQKTLLQIWKEELGSSSLMEALALQAVKKP